MVRDKAFKLIGIPLLGFLIPLSSHLFNFRLFDLSEMITLFFFFLIPSFFTWQGVLKINFAVRNSRFNDDTYLKLLLICTGATLCSFLIIGGSILILQDILSKPTSIGSLLEQTFPGSIFMIFCSLIYEILFLSKERQIDSQIVTHLDKELLHAEINVLQNELDPHFVYNSLMPLYYLVKNDIQKAEAFACKLIQVYQYFLENRQNDFITLKEELKFIENYFFLLQIRFKDSVFLSVRISSDTEKLMVLPLSLQILIENVIKHNDFDKNDPLNINIDTERNQLVVSNNLRCKTHVINSSKIGLNNLRMRYKILASSDISVIKNKELFIVKIPLIRNAKAYDVNSYNRG